MKLAPIILFTYNRPFHTRVTVEALQKNHLAAQSELFVYSDAPRKLEHADNVSEVRAYIRNVTGFRTVTVIERDDNLGLAKSIISGVTEIVNRFGKIIVLEDDMVTSPYFLRYMNESLDMYEKEERVISIHGYVYPVKEILPETFFLRGADCWGWATWKRGWSLFEADGKLLFDKIKQENLNNNFDFNGAYPFTKMLQEQIDGRNDSWAIRWYASAFLKNRLTLYPGRSLISNIGNDDSGTHCNDTYIYDTDYANTPLLVESIVVEENVVAIDLLTSYFNSIRPSFFRRIFNRLKVR